MLLGSSNIQLAFQLSLVCYAGNYLYKILLLLSLIFFIFYAFTKFPSTVILGSIGGNECVQFAIFNWKLLFSKTLLEDSIPDQSPFFLSPEYFLSVLINFAFIHILLQFLTVWYMEALFS